MFTKHLKIVIFTSFPETIMVILLGLQLTNIKYPYKSRIIFTSLVQALIAFFVMALDLNIAFNFIIQLSSMIILTKFFLKIKYSKATIVILIGVFLQGIIQSIILPALHKILGVQISKLTSNFHNAIICFIPVFIISIVVLLIFKKKHFYLLDINYQ